jgi:hypothetical protein
LCVSSKGRGQGRPLTQERQGRQQGAATVAAATAAAATAVAALLASVSAASVTVMGGSIAASAVAVATTRLTAGSAMLMGGSTAASAAAMVSSRPTALRATTPTIQIRTPTRLAASASATLAMVMVGCGLQQLWRQRPAHTRRLQLLRCGDGRLECNIAAMAQARGVASVGHRAQLLDRSHQQRGQIRWSKQRNPTVSNTQHPITGSWGGPLFPRAPGGGSEVDAGLRAQGYSDERAKHGKREEEDAGLQSGGQGGLAYASFCAVPLICA